MAKTENKISGNLILVSLDGETIGCTTGCTLTITNERIETTCKDNDGARTYEPGSQDCSLQVNGITKFDTVSNFPSIFQTALGKDIVVWRVESSNSDDPYFQFEGFITNCTFEGPLNAPSTWSFDASPTGQLFMFNS